MQVSRCLQTYTFADTDPTQVFEQSNLSFVLVNVLELYDKTMVQQSVASQGKSKHTSNGRNETEVSITDVSYLFSSS